MKRKLADAKNKPPAKRKFCFCPDIVALPCSVEEFVLPDHMKPFEHYRSIQRNKYASKAQRSSVYTTEEVPACSCSEVCDDDCQNRKLFM
jgi:hypothetical protein